MVGSKDIDLFNLRENEQIVSPCLIIHGKCNKQNGAKTVQVQHPQLPPLTYPIHNQFFKATVLLTPGENKLTFVTDTNTARTVCVLLHAAVAEPSGASLFDLGQGLP